MLSFQLANSFFRNMEYFVSTLNWTIPKRHATLLLLQCCILLVYGDQCIGDWTAPCSTPSGDISKKHSL